MARSIKHWTLDFGSGHDLTVCGFKPRAGLCVDGVEPAWDSLSPFSAPTSYSLSLKINKLKLLKCYLTAICEVKWIEKNLIHMKVIFLI